MSDSARIKKLVVAAKFLRKKRKIPRLFPLWPLFISSIRNEGDDERCILESLHMDGMRLNKRDAIMLEIESDRHTQ